MIRAFLVFNIFFFVGLLVISWFIELTLPIMLAFALITGIVFGLGYEIKKDDPGGDQSG
ncbi:MAG: hypothetical protein AAB575_05310 [Patescibacteria group bacterium]